MAIDADGFLEYAQGALRVKGQRYDYPTCTWVSVADSAWGLVDVGDNSESLLDLADAIGTAWILTADATKASIVAETDAAVQNAGAGLGTRDIVVNLNTARDYPGMELRVKLAGPLLSARFFARGNTTELYVTSPVTGSGDDLHLLVSFDVQIDVAVAFPVQPLFEQLAELVSLGGHATNADIQPAGVTSAAATFIFDTVRGYLGKESTFLAAEQAINGSGAPMNAANFRQQVVDGQINRVFRDAASEAKYFVLPSYEFDSTVDELASGEAAHGNLLVVLSQPSSRIVTVTVSSLEDPAARAQPTLVSSYPVLRLREGEYSFRDDATADHSWTADLGYDEQTQTLQFTIECWRATHVHTVTVAVKQIDGQLYLVGSDGSRRPLPPEWEDLTDEERYLLLHPREVADVAPGLVRSVKLSYDPASQLLSGDVTGSPGQLLSAPAPAPEEPTFAFSYAPPALVSGAPAVN